MRGKHLGEVATNADFRMRHKSAGKDGVGKRGVNIGNAFGAITMG